MAKCELSLSIADEGLQGCREDIAQLAEKLSNLESPDKASHETKSRYSKFLTHFAPNELICNGVTQVSFKYRP